MNKHLSALIVYRRNRKKYLSEIRSLEWATEEEIFAYQRDQLERVLKDAKENVSYYRKRVEGIRLSDFPILTRQAIKEEREDLIVSKRIDSKTREDTTSGSTSVPVSFLLDYEHRERGMILKLFFNEWAGLQLGEPMIKFWGLFPAESWKGRLHDRISYWSRNIIPVSTLDFRMERLEEFQDIFRKKDPKLILAYNLPLYEFAKVLRRSNKTLPIHGAIMTSTSTQTPEIRATLKEIFQCEIFDRYGTREMMDIACDCEKHEGLHVCPYLQFVEIVDDKGNPVPKGVPGRIVATQLHNTVMPLIRYDTGDIGTWAEEKCSCGRNWPLIKQIDGRAICMFKHRDGGRLGSYYFMHHLNNIIGQDQFSRQQIIQTNYDAFTVRLVLYEPANWGQFSQARTAYAEAIESLVGEPVNITYDLVDEIPTLPSGKYLQVICEIPEE